MPVSSPGMRRTIFTDDAYEAAEAVVDRLADQGFPVEHLAIVGRDLRLVEQVVGRLSAAKAALSSGGSGLVLGAALGLLFGAWFTHDGTSLLAVLVYWALFGALLGAAVALLGYALDGGRRNFTSVSSMQPSGFDVLVEDAFADEALRLLGSAGVATNSPTTSMKEYSHGQSGRD